MSLFPAYSSSVSSNPAVSVPSKPNDLSWLSNQSFIAFPSAGNRDDASESDQNNIGAIETNTRSNRSSKRERKKKKKKHHKKRRHSSSDSESNPGETDAKSKLLLQPPVVVSELEYYTDLDALKIYLTVETLHRPACPKYRLGCYRFGRKGKFQGAKIQRYFRYFKKAKQFTKDSEWKDDIKDKEIEMEKDARSNNSVEKWIDYIEFKENHPVHMDSYQNHKAELAIIEKAMRYHPDDERLLQLYLEGIVKVHPTDEVLEMIQKLISKDNTNVLLWDALISNKQSAMAQCIAPNVLKLYEKSTRSLFMAKRSDEVMLRFFKKCATFCRQAGLWEHLFGLIQLTVSLNVSTTFASGKHLFASPEHYHQLIEYEELILKSGLPMNEIWLRIEKLRSAFHFLPFGGTNMCSDPQRMVLHEDVIGFVYPLINKEYSFDLVILILKLMKYPFESSAFERCTVFKPEPYESDHAEQLLPLLLDLNRNRKVDSVVMNLIKELCTPPSFINTNLAFESYLDVMRELLISASEYFSDEKNIALLLLYLKLERILIVNDKTMENLNDERKKSCRGRIKKLLKNSKYQNELEFYVEYGLIEYEMEGFGTSCMKIFNTSIQMFCSAEDRSDDNDLFTLVLRLTEILLKENRKTEAIHLMTKLALNPNEISLNPSDSVGDPSKLLALQKLKDRANHHLQEDDHGEHMLLEQYFRPNPTVNSLKVYLYYMALIKSKAETIRKIDGFLFHFNNVDNQRHAYIREQIFEIYLKILEFRLDEFSNIGFMQVIDRVLHEYPDNLNAIRLCTFSESLSWFQMRTILGKRLTTTSVLLMVAAARIRNLYSTVGDENDCKRGGETYKRRILNLLKHAVRRESTLRQNALLWRLYLRELFDQPNCTRTETGRNVLEDCRKTVYMALEACPWNKALYLDGAFFAPQELSQLLDLLMEKQLRIHAIPEELEILRNE
ncbi:nuclear exosome regulator NRDE2 [Toxorhynchites rutilus septentrionalis]|uniref:nuclear exosome regulator NRDE2 n=1 Tax=Toxorhynchites rutilus septentrionalis TaxID=329112 RepID=UPI00247A985C|nr:nuclear exosome regulator NRDE2 [Toxorhynchites rutilus septentrionalis]